MGWRAAPAEATKNHTRRTPGRRKQGSVSYRATLSLKSSMNFKPRVLALLLAFLVAGAAVVAQRGGGGWATIRRPGPDTFTGDFMFCRLAFRSSYGGFGGGWGVDYPRADENLSIRLSELSETAVNFDNTAPPTTSSFRQPSPNCSNVPSSR